MLAVVAFAAAAGVATAHPKTGVSGDWTYVPVEIETVAEFVRTSCSAASRMVS